MSTIHVPLPVPTHPNVQPPAELTGTAKSEYDRVFTHFANPEYCLPGISSEKASKLTEEECMWLSYECILRYIRAAKHDVATAIKRIEETLKWRRDFGIYDTLTAELVEPEAVTGKEFLFGYDTRGRPGLYMCPSKQNTEEGPRQIQFVVWVLERAIDLMGPGVETLVFMIDFADKAKNSSFSTSRTVLNILQSHYPERLGAGLVAHLPWILHAFMKLIMPFVDPLTRTKAVFNPVQDDRGLWRSAEARDKGQSNDPKEPNAQLFELDQLVHDGWGGTQMFTYDHDIYWPALVEMCETRRKDMARMWRKLGGAIGIKEWDVKVGVRDEKANEEKVGATEEASQ
ncbi:CRAL TRIO domain-containing protein [Pisolithus orientalis]|uniref:CRAL TRIO domain-containing protein n=1 Tax=Pisolithus orientalis TaxID=936130 RepID=UPI00222529B4|nr:CRAL TRIO domain-containing protein [Pisolithus orientalis]KAI6025876.1 CRAL TRIO domain-containing protein [Pisolithus orientalis]